MSMPHTSTVPTDHGNSRFNIRFPDPATLPSQDVEWCEVELDGKWRRFRFHDYDEIYNIPGLYESLFYRTLRCSSPRRVVGLLERTMLDLGHAPSTLDVLDVGAGNGMVGAALQSISIRSVVGADIIPEARQATQRDRPWVYDDYFVVDLTDLPESTEKKLRSHKLNCLTTVAALGFGDIPTRAFLQSLDLLQTPAWLAFNIKEDFLADNDDTGFAALVRRLNADRIIQVQSYQRYCHRLSLTGEPLYYVAMIATKERDLPDDLMEKA